MVRRPTYTPLGVYMNNRRVGTLSREPGGAIAFMYHPDWLATEGALPISLSLPLREELYRGQSVTSVFDNLLPDSDAVRRRVAERVGARGTDAYNLLAVIGRDCIGALQFLECDEDPGHLTGNIVGEIVDADEIERILKGLVQAPLGLRREDDFRISVAGAQEKTALLFHGGRWKRPHGSTPTTHIFKAQIGALANGIDMSDSVENEFYCLQLVKAFGLPVTRAEIATFGDTRVLIVERFDRRWTADGRLLRLPQEDCCQALSIPPTRKYQSDGGPGIVDILRLLAGSDNALRDQTTVLKAQLIFWLIGATDGHAKNFSIFIGRGSTYALTPLYDILTAQPALVRGQIEKRQMRLAMSVGKSRNYRFDKIVARHFLESGRNAGLSERVVNSAIEEVADTTRSAVEAVSGMLPAEFPAYLHDAIAEGTRKRAGVLTTSLAATGHTEQ